MSEKSSVKPKIFPVYGYYGIEGSRMFCGACEAPIPDRATHCPECGTPVYGRTGEGSYSKCKACGAYIPNREGREKCPNCREPIS